LKKDALEYKKKFWELRKTPPPSDRWKRTLDVLHECGYCTISPNHVRAYRNLLQLREDHPGLAEQFRNERGDQNQLVWHYDWPLLRGILAGRRLHESDAPSEPHDGQLAKSDLPREQTEFESEIELAIRARAAGPAKGEVIAREMGYPYNSYFRKALS